MHAQKGKTNVESIEKFSIFKSNSDNYVTNAHFHKNHAMILFPLRCTMMVEDEIDLGRRSLEPHYFYFINAGLAHATQANRLKQEHIALYINKNWQKHIIKSIFDASRLSNSNGVWPLSFAALKLTSILISDTGVPASNLKDVRQPILAKLLVEDCLEQIIKAEPISGAHPEDHGSGLILSALEILREDLSERTSIDCLARRFGVSRRHLTRMFRNKTGRSIGQFLRDERLKEASRLLIETKWSIHQIGLSVGFDSASGFSSAFRTHYKVSPAEYRLREAGL